jgi:GST-like protein
MSKVFPNADGALGRHSAPHDSGRANSFSGQPPPRCAVAYVVYGDKGSGAFCVEAALAEAGVDHEFRMIALDANDQKKPAFLAINPSGKIPVLQLPGGGILTESLAILLAIAERHPEAALLPPPASAGRAQAYQWLAYMASEIYPMVEIADYPERFLPPGEPALTLRSSARHRIRERLLILERAIAGPWLMPDTFSIADIYAAMFSRWSIGDDWRETHLPKINELSKALSQRPRIAPVWDRHFG